jgi:hypothetical protein
MKLLLLLLLTPALMASDWYLFTSFRSNGETGVFLALSPDGKKWTTPNESKPWVKVEKPGMLMRDPWLGQGPDGTWHMLWTWGWTSKDTGGLKIGYASSKDLLTWTPQREIPLMQNEPTARNAWAPEAVWDEEKKLWVIFWATTIPGRFPDTEGTGDSGYNHRIYSMTTKDWVTFTPAKLYFDPGFNCIDSTVVHAGAGASKPWVMIFKDERKNPLKKNLRLAFADLPEGPWTNISEPFTEPWNEGPTAIQIGNEWWIYLDHYQKPQHYGAVRTRDWKTFEGITAEVTFPVGQRHGTVVKIPEAVAMRLQAALQ